MGIVRMIFKDTKRLAFALILTIPLLYVFMTGEYQSFREAVQAYMYAILRVTTGFILGHILGKAVFGSVNWHVAKVTDANVVGRLLVYALSVWGMVNV